MIDRVTAFKLLGFYVSCDLKWSEQVDAIVSKAASRLQTVETSRCSNQGTTAFLHICTAAGH